MNRRRFLSFLGLAPVAAAVPAMALPRAEKPVIDARGADPEALRRLRSEIAEGQSKWLEDIEQATGPHEATATRIDLLEKDCFMVDGRPAYCRVPAKALSEHAEIIFFKDGQLVIRAAKVQV